MPRTDWMLNGGFTFAGGYRAMADAARGRRRRPPTAAFAASDEMAFGAMTAIREAGLRAPDDLSVIGIDGHEYGEVVGLTTFAQYPSGAGCAAARVLLDELTGKPALPWFDPAPVVLVERTSAAPPPAD